MYLWEYANESHPASAIRRRGARREATDKQVVFRVEIAASPEPTSPIPLENAKQLLSRLISVDWRFNSTFDVIAHSRGGLVIRSLIERPLPKSGWQARFNRVVFVACTNEGTILAEPENWESLVNLYTNLVVGACRVLGLITPQSLVVTAVLSDIIESIGTFVKYCADSAVTDRVVPGLSAMKPEARA